MSGVDTKQHMDHVVVVMFLNRSFDNLLGYLYEPGEVAFFEGVAGRTLSNPIPDYAPDAHRGVVPVHPDENMDTPNPDPGEEYQHVNTQLFRTVSPPDNRFKLAEAMQAPFNAPEDARRQPTMDGFVTDYVNAFHAETGRMPQYDEYAQIMACYTPEQMPVFSTLAKGFACFDHWFCEVPSQTFTNRSFFHAASASGFVVNAPYKNFPKHNTAETIFERLEAAGVPWRVYGDPDMRISFTGLIHANRLSPFFKTHFSSIHDFYEDAERGTLPAYAFIEPNMLHGHNDMHPPINALSGGLSVDTPSSLLGGEAFLAKIYDAIRASSTSGGSNFASTPTRPCSPCRPDGVPVRPFRYSPTHASNLHLHRQPHGRQRGVPQHLADPHAARTLVAWRPAHRPRCDRCRYRPHPQARDTASSGGLARRSRQARSAAGGNARPPRPATAPAGHISPGHSARRRKVDDRPGACDKRQRGDRQRGARVLRSVPSSYLPRHRQGESSVRTVAMTQ